MLRFTTKLINSNQSLFMKIVRTMSNVNPLISEQPLITEETDKAVKRAAPEEISDENIKHLKTEDKPKRIKKNNCAMLLGYLGANYFGMQKNDGVKTIEEELFRALLEINLINEENYKTIQTVNFQRAARTDKYVSAAGQIVNLKLPADPDKDLINKHLPEDIRIFSIKRVTKGFNSKSMCDARTYSYTLPTYAFATDKVCCNYDGTEVDELYEKKIQEYSLIDGKPCFEYRISEEKLDMLPKMLKKFEGSHNFHNFTSKIRPLDPRARRFIISFTAGKPFVENGVEFLTLEVKGQSFMMHQIRKMVGMVLGILRESTTEEIFDRCFLESKIDLPRAPGLGLVLKTVHMDYYNRRYGEDGVHDKLDWTECDEMEKFFKERILQHIVETEIKEKNMVYWLANMPYHKFNIRLANQESEKNDKEDSDVKSNEKEEDEDDDTNSEELKVDGTSS